MAAVAASALQIAQDDTERGHFSYTLCLVICIVAAGLDVATRRIPNKLTYPAILLGLGISIVSSWILRPAGFEVAVIWLGSVDAVNSLLGFGLAAVIGIVSFLARGLGGGDVKLLGALGAFLGVGGFIPVFLNALVAAALIGLVNWAARGTLIPRLQVVSRNVLVSVWAGQSWKDVYPFGRSESPFGVALLLGLVSAPFLPLAGWIMDVIR